MKRKSTIPILNSILGKFVAAMCAASAIVGSLAAQQPPLRLDTLVVEVASRVSPDLPATTRSIQLLTRDEISTLPVRTISELLEWATGVDVDMRSPAQSDLSIRGASFEQVVVLVNGVRMSDPQTGHFDLDVAVPLELVERVEVLRGAASALYGADAMGGVVNIVTRRGGNSASGHAQGGTWGTAHLFAGAGFETPGGLVINAGADASRSDGHREGTDYEASQLHLSVSNPAGGGSMRGEVSAARRDFGAQDFYAPYPSFERTRTYSASIGWTSRAADRLRWEMQFTARRHDDEFILVRDDPSIYSNDHTSWQSGGVVLGRLKASSSVNIAVGSELFWDVLNSTNLGDRTERRGAVFGEAVIGKRGPAALSIGIRSDWHQGYGSFLSPSVSASVQALPGVRLRGAAGRSFRAPTWTERYYQSPANIGQPNLAPERAWSGELGADLLSGQSFQLLVTFFARRSSSLIDWARPSTAGDTVPWETRNVEDATFLGVEADLELEGPLDLRWTLGGTAMDVNAEEAAGFHSKYALRPLTQQLTVGVERRIGSRFSIRIRGRHGQRQGEEAYRRVDLRASVLVGPGWLHLDALNITDTDYPDVTGARAPGRALLVGFGLRRH